MPIQFNAKAWVRCDGVRTVVVLDGSILKEQQAPRRRLWQLERSRRGMPGRATAFFTNWRWVWAGILARVRRRKLECEMHS